MAFIQVFYYVTPPLNKTILTLLPLTSSLPPSLYLFPSLFLALFRALFLTFFLSRSLFTFIPMVRFFILLYFHTNICPDFRSFQRQLHIIECSIISLHGNVLAFVSLWNGLFFIRFRRNRRILKPNNLILTNPNSRLHSLSRKEDEQKNRRPAFKPNTSLGKSNRRRMAAASIAVPWMKMRNCTR